jgi:hypothetical protein
LQSTDPYIAQHTALIASARRYRLTNSTDGRYGQGFVNGYVARCLRDAARARRCLAKDRAFSRVRDRMPGCGIFIIKEAA